MKIFILLTICILFKNDYSHFPLQSQKSPISLPIIFFDKNSSLLNDSAMHILDSMSVILMNEEKIKIGVFGFANIDEENKEKLSLTRAENVFNYLIIKGLKSKNLEIYFYADKIMLTDCRKWNCSETEKARNRRVELIIID